MKIARLYTGDDGESHFGEMDIEIKNMNGYMRSDLIEVKGIFFAETPADLDRGWHNAPRRQIAIGIEGIIEVEVGDGTKRQFKPGEAMLVEDKTGRGHKYRSVDHKPGRTMYIPFEYNT